MNVILILILIATVLALFCALLVKLLIEKVKDNRELKKRIERRNDNIRYLLDHARSLGAIQKDNAELLRRIRNAKNDDDIDSVIGDIIKRNNDRVPHASN